MINLSPGVGHSNAVTNAVAPSVYEFLEATTIPDTGGNRRPKAENRRPKTEGRKPKAENRKPKTEGRKPKAENRKPKTENRRASSYGNLFNTIPARLRTN
jgi:hypothetical protein